MLDALQLTRDLVRMDTINPPGKEGASCKLLGRILEQSGFAVSTFEFLPGRTTIVAQIGGNTDKPPICLTGHVDTVPLGLAPWTVDPLSAEIQGDRLYGRGSSDMKSGVAGMVACAAELAPRLRAGPGLVLVITAGEETGCQGAFHLVRSGGFRRRCGALLVGEPTSNYPMVGHKGAFWVRASTTGVTAHGSMPQEGRNAIYPLAHAITRLQNFKLDAPQHPVLGKPTMNIGTVHGGININSVPDAASIEVDFRTVAGMSNESLSADLVRYLGDTVKVDTLLDLESVYSNPSDPWVVRVFEIVRAVTQLQPLPDAVAYFTDASALTPAAGHPPTLILGPGEAAMAHKTDEYCLISRLHQSVELYKRIVCDWCSL